MLLLGRILFISGFVALGLQIEESWMGWLGLPITRDNLPLAMGWWTCFGGMSALGVWLMRKYGPPLGE